MRTTATKAATTFRSISTERLREIKERADYLALKNAALRGELLEREAITKAGEEMLIAAKSLVETSSMSRNEKQDFLENLASWPVVVKDVAKRQTRQIHIRSEGGKENDE